MIVSLSIQFVAEVNWPGRIDIGTGIAKVGNSSLSLTQALFQDGRCVATSESTIVQIDAASWKSRLLTEKAKAFLAQHMLE